MLSRPALRPTEKLRPALFRQPILSGLYTSGMEYAFQIESSARTEAESLYPLVGKNGNTVESLFELIAIPQGVMKVLREYADSDPTEARWVESALRFRGAVGLEFEKLTAKKTGTGTPSFRSDDTGVQAPNARLLGWDSTASTLPAIEKTWENSA